MLGYGAAPPLLFWAAVSALVVATWFQNDRSNVICYAALLGIQMWIPGLSSAVALRFAVADLFLAPVIARWFWRALRAKRWPASGFDSVIAALGAIVFAAIAIGVWRTGQLTAYVWLNKGVGILLLIGGLYALTSHLRTRADLGEVVTAFVIGVSAANILALAATAMAAVGVGIATFPIGGARLYGWMVNPSSYGSLLVTVALIELARIGLDGQGHRWRTRVRIANVALLLLSVLLTFSRSAWLALAGGAALLMAAEIFYGVAGRQRRWRVAAAALAIVAATAPFAWAGLQQRQRLAVIAREGAPADQVKERVADACVAQWDQEVCESVPAAALNDARARIAQRDPEDAYGVRMNVRGLSDRLAILQAAWDQYTSTPVTVAFGIGLGTFLATSAPAFGVPLIVHNTPAWFLVEMGPAGLAVWMWLLVRIAAALWRNRGAPQVEPGLVHGIAAAVAAWVVFSMFNEAFYFRHFWLLLACAECLRVLRSTDPLPRPIQPVRITE